MKRDFVCKFCNQEFAGVEGRSFSNHVRWCDKNTGNGDKGRSSLSAGLKKFWSNKQGKFQKFEVCCKKCGKSFSVRERSKLFPQRNEYFCSRSCANSRIVSDEMKEAIRKKLIKEPVSKFCNICSNNYYGRRKFCSDACISASKQIQLSGLKLYRLRCSFRFSLNDFPEEFDFSLVEKHGWYKAANRGNNLRGISRDHIVSVKYGFLNNIDPHIIAHPANCQLMQHHKNIGKHTKCNLTIDELLKKIEVWDTRYSV